MLINSDRGNDSGNSNRCTAPRSGRVRRLRPLLVAALLTLGGGAQADVFNVLPIGAGTGNENVPIVNFPIARFASVDHFNLPTEYTGQVNWGDGSAISVMTVNVGVSLYEASESHTYTAPGTYTVSYCIIDTFMTAPNTMTPAGPPAGVVCSTSFPSPPVIPSAADTSITIYDCGDGIVDPGETCDESAANGTATSCCSARCLLVATGTTCRPGSGDLCDPDETCTGRSPICPADVVSVAATTCRTGSGDSCDADETCTGTPTAACPADDAPGNLGNQCRASAGTCDLPESCTGAPGAACPADSLTPAGTECRAATDPTCDPAETCTGAAVDCPPDSFTAAGTVCGALTGTDCKDPDMCDGAGTCDPGITAPDGTPCPNDLAASCIAGAGGAAVPNECEGGTCTLGASAGGDADTDGICQDFDNCTDIFNPGQSDFDLDGVGNHCEPAPAPATSPWGLGLALLLMVGIAAGSLLRGVRPQD